MARGGRSPSSRMASVTQIPDDGRLGRERVSEIQRTRILVAMAEVACERGASNVSVAQVVERAGISRRTFYELFEDKEDCLLATLKETIARASSYVAGGRGLVVSWAERTRSELESLLQFLEEEPAFGRLAVVESFGAGGKAREMRDAVVVSLVVAVDAGRARSTAGTYPTRMTAEGVVGGVASVIYGRLVSEASGRLVDLVNPLMSMIVLPYLGPAAARREMKRPVAEISPRRSTVPINHLKHLDMRLTYRTVRVLTAVAVRPGASNRAIGEAAGVGDQGQISKLLGRLAGLGLVENARLGPSRGATNAWALTEQGKEVADVLATRAARS